MSISKPEISSELLLRAERISFSFPEGTAALRELSLSAQAGEFVSILGPSGCGKSTLLRLLAGLIAPTHGSLALAGQSPGAWRRETRGIGFVFQSPTLLPWRTVRENLHLPAELSGDASPDLAARVEQVLATVGLSSFAHAYPRQLSGGMKMRAALARELVSKPSVLLLDEPFAALDEITRQQLQDELLDLWRKNRWTVFFVTHNVFEAAYLSTRVVILSERPARLVQDLAVSNGESRPADWRSQPEYARLAGRISAALRGTA